MGPGGGAGARRPGGGRAIMRVFEGCLVLSNLTGPASNTGLLPSPLSLHLKPS